MDMRSALAPLVGLVMLAAGNSASAATVSLSMDDDPVAEGWGLAHAGGSHSVSNGILHIDSPEYYEFQAPRAAWDEPDKFRVASWSVETRVRRDPGSQAAPSIWMSPGLNFVHAGLTADRLVLEGAFPGTHEIDTSVYHTYRFESFERSLRVLVDGALAMSFDRTVPWGASFGVSFGDHNMAAAGDATMSEWDYFTATTTPVPESTASIEDPPVASASSSSLVWVRVWMPMESRYTAPISSTGGRSRNWRPLRAT